MIYQSQLKPCQLLHNCTKIKLKNTAIGLRPWRPFKPL